MGLQSQGSRKEWKGEMRQKWEKVNWKRVSPICSWLCNKNAFQLYQMAFTASTKKDVKAVHWSPQCNEMSCKSKANE